MTDLQQHVYLTVGRAVLKEKGKASTCAAFGAWKLPGFHSVAPAPGGQGAALLGTHAVQERGLGSLQKCRLLGQLPERVPEAVQRGIFPLEEQAAPSSRVCSLGCALPRSAWGSPAP